MSGVGLTFELETAQAAAVLERLGTAELADIAYAVGQLVESQTMERIDAEKQSPEGQPWAAWSDAYAATRRPGHSLLVGDGNLLGSVQNYTRGLTIEVGTNLPYGAIHQFGGADVGKPGLPARPWLGLSSENEAEVRDLVTGSLSEILQ